MDLVATNQLTMTLAPPRLQLDLFGARHWLPETLTRAQLVAALGGSLSSACTVYAVPRCVFGPEASEAEEIGSCCCSFESNFEATSAWMPSVPQTARALSCFLSSLFVLVKAVERDQAMAGKLVQLMRAWTHDFAPAVMAWHLLLHRCFVQLTNPFKSALANAFWRLMRQMLSPKIDDGTLLEQSRLFIGCMLNVCENAGAECFVEPMTALETIDLTCPLSKRRMVEPVRVPGKLQGTFDKASLLERQRGGSLWNTWQSTPARTSLSLYEDIQTNEMEPDDEMAACLRASPTGCTELRLFPRPMTATGMDDAVCFVCLDGV